jgi:hypothetical protein
MVDVALTVAVGVPVVGTTLASGIEQDRVLAGLGFGLAATLPLLVRRRWPFAVLAVSLAAAIATTVDGQYVFPIMVALYTIGSARSWEATVAAAAAPPAAGLVYILGGGTESTCDDLLAVGLTCAVSAGFGLRRRRRSTPSIASSADAGVAVAATAVQCPDRRLRRSVRDEGWQGVRPLCGAPAPSGWLGRMCSR